MRSTLALLALATSAAAQAVTQLIVPSSTPPAACENSRVGTFQLTIISAGGETAAESSIIAASPDGSGAAPTSTLARRAFEHVARQQNGELGISLQGGVLTDGDGRTGYIASNYQFQFDKPPQAGAIYTAGFSICQNGSLALGGSAVFWQCKSGAFFNLYDRNWAPHCDPVYFEAVQGIGTAYSTAPPRSESTGPDQATIKNGGGTQSMNNTMTTGVGFDVTQSTPASASATGSGASSGSGSGSGGAKATSSSGGAVGGGFDANGPQALLAWVVGIFGAIALA